MIEIEHITSWCEVLLGEISHRITKGTTPTSLGFGFTNKGILFVKVESLVNQRINHTLCTFIDSNTDEALARSRLQEGDVLISIAGTLGRVAIVQKNDIPANTNQAIAIIRLVEPISSKYIAQFLLSQLLEAQIQKQGRGVGLQNLNLQQVSEFAIPLPPLNEQRRIVAKIEALKARSQRVKEALEDIPQLLHQFRQSVLAAAFRGDLTADWREQNSNVEPVSELLKRVRDKRKMLYEEECVKAKVEGKRKPKKPTNLEPEIRFSDSEIDISPTWIWTSFEDISSIKEHSMSSGPFGSALGTKDYRDSGVPVIRGQNVQNGRFVLKNLVYISGEKALELKRSKAYPRDIVIVAVGAGAGNAAIVPYDLPESILSQNCNKFTIDEYLAIPEYIILVLQIQIFKAQIQEIITDTARQFLSLTNLKEIIFPIPPLEEQKEIVRRVQSFFKISEQIEQKYYEVKTYINQLDQSILAKAFRGELVPQDPDDEPASVLLERIRAERAKLQTKAAKKSTPQTGGRRSKKALQQQAEPVQLELGLE